ncbi:SLC13 family permease [Mongoliitalea daihaiensis]|uniref:SLC13 family permease n=1 Tax=Mongoliitalea daihaiensis TaxID=2782006 RepID=UPI001F2B36BC|nr:SLC13 family permease [Mongoliitalea daihaiensis]UJP65139.1 SLC13 family permease [Mongoliitalea daihaiensis]
MRELVLLDDWNWELLLVLGLLFSAIIMFVQNKPRMDAVGMLMLAALPLTGILSIDEALTGFSDPNIVLIALLFVLGEGLVRTGVARDIGDWIYQKAGNQETKLLLLLMVSVAGLGSVMSSTAIVAIFIPVVLRISSNTGISPSKLMMPLSFAALISGMMTLISTAPNLVVNSELVRQGLDGFSFFAITPFGIAILLMGLGYMVFARKFIPDRSAGKKSKKKRPTIDDWMHKYKLRLRQYRLEVQEDSSLLGLNFDALDFSERGLHLFAIERRDKRQTVFHRPSKQMALQEGDVLLLDVADQGVQLSKFTKQYGLKRLLLTDRKRYMTDLSQELGMTEAIIPVNSPLVGQTIHDARVRSDSGVTVLGLWRADGLIEDTFLDEEIRVGDTLLIAGFWDDIKRFQQDDRSYVVLLHLPAEFDDMLPARTKGLHAIVILALVVTAMVTGIIPNVLAVLIGALLMGLFRIIDMNSAYNAISWKSLVLIVGMMPFSLALQRTGGIELASDVLVDLVGDSAPRVGIGALFLITAILGLFISNTATAVLMAPVAISMAMELGVSPYPFAMAVTLAASSAFMTPVSSPVNTLVVAPGNYAFGDFVRMGVPFTILILLLSVFLIPVFLPF